ncbi:hypothetical protein JHK85_009901 [Glycine max]|nr:hypothetical protein JHK85_009901 [Glycine max]KAG5065913.1 hypothetical protein JHK86_009644 [Glycine max]
MDPDQGSSKAWKLAQQQPKGVNGGSNRIAAVNVTPSNNLPTPSHQDDYSNHEANIFQGCADAVKSEAYADAVRFSSLFIRHMEILHSRIGKLFSDFESIQVRLDAAMLLKQLDFPFTCVNCNALIAGVAAMFECFDVIAVAITPVRLPTLLLLFLWSIA